MFVSTIENVNSLRSFVIPKFHLWPNCVAAERDMISLEHLAIAEERKRVLFLVNNDAISFALRAERFV
jgi:hypothetical protein